MLNITGILQNKMSGGGQAGSVLKFFFWGGGGADIIQCMAGAPTYFNGIGEGGKLVNILFRRKEVGIELQEGGGRK